MSLAIMESFLEEFGDAIGIPGLRPDEERRCNLMIDDVALSFELGMRDDSLLIYSLLGPAPDGDAQAAYAALLHANYAFAETGGSTLGIDPRTGGIVLVREERLESLRLARLESVVEEFVDVAERWMKRIDSGDLGAQPAAAPPQAPPSPEGMMRV